MTSAHAPAWLRLPPPSIPPFYLLACSAVEAVRDLAVVAALLRSAEQGGSRVAVRQF